MYRKATTFLTLLFKSVQNYIPNTENRLLSKMLDPSVTYRIFMELSIMFAVFSCG